MTVQHSVHKVHIVMTKCTSFFYERYNNFLSRHNHNYYDTTIITMVQTNFTNVQQFLINVQSLLHFLQMYNHFLSRYNHYYHLYKQTLLCTIISYQGTTIITICTNKPYQCCITSHDQLPLHLMLGILFSAPTIMRYVSSDLVV